MRIGPGLASAQLELPAIHPLRYLHFERGRQLALASYNQSVSLQYCCHARPEDRLGMPSRSIVRPLHLQHVDEPDHRSII